MLIQKNPLTMLGTLSKCWLFTFQTPIETAVQLLPPELEPVQHRDYAFWNVVVCQVQNMRPKLSPLPLGVTCWHVAYRLYVRMKPSTGEVVEGLYFLRSDCNNALMSFVGNLLTDFKFNIASVQVSQSSQSTEITISAPEGDAYARISNDPPALPEYSAFDSLEEARQFLKYKPNGVSIGANGSANIVHIVRDEKAWKSNLVVVDEAHWSFLEGKNVKPEICYEVEPIHYQWNRARRYTSALTSQKK